VIVDLRCVLINYSLLKDLSFDATVTGEVNAKQQIVLAHGKICFTSSTFSIKELNDVLSSCNIRINISSCVCTKS